MNDAARDASAAIRLDAVRKRFRGSEVLRGVDLHVPRGALLGLVGLNGAGKTTTLRVILGLLRPDGGRVEVLGRPASAIASLSPRVGATLHLPGLDPRLTARDNLRQHALLHGRRADPDEVLRRLDLGYLLDRRIARVSQGERQRVALARALLLDPEVLVLDEPLTHLDPGAVFRVLEVLREHAARRGRTVLLSSHQLELVEQSADRLALLHAGRVLLDGTMGELLAGASRRWVVRAAPADRAREILAAAPGVMAVHSAAEAADVAAPADAWVVEARDADPAEWNARLHGDGVRVALLAPEQQTLSRVFRDAIRGAELDAPAASSPATSSPAGSSPAGSSPAASSSAASRAAPTREVGS